MYFPYNIDNIIKQCLESIVLSYNIDNIIKSGLESYQYHYICGGQIAFYFILLFFYNYFVTLNKQRARLSHI